MIQEEWLSVNGEKCTLSTGRLSTLGLPRNSVVSIRPPRHDLGYLTTTQTKQTKLVNFLYIVGMHLCPVKVGWGTTKLLYCMVQMVLQAKYPILRTHILSLR